MKKFKDYIKDDQLKSAKAKQDTDKVKELTYDQLVNDKEYLEYVKFAKSHGYIVTLKDLNDGADT